MFDPSRFTTVKAGEDTGRESRLLVEARRRREGLEVPEVKEDDFFDPLKEEMAAQAALREQQVARIKENSRRRADGDQPFEIAEEEEKHESVEAPPRESIEDPGTDCRVSESEERASKKIPREFKNEFSQGRGSAGKENKANEDDLLS